MKKLFLLFVISCFTVSLNAQSNYTSDSIQIKKISDYIMNYGSCYDNLRDLTKNIGNRISGSEASMKAIAWAGLKLKKEGADSVWLQPVRVPHWVRGNEWLKVQWQPNGEYDNVEMISLGNTEGTQGKVLQRAIVCVNNLDEFAALPDSIIKDKIIFFNYHFRQDIINTFYGYGDAVRYRYQAVDSAARHGAAAVLIRSVSTGADDVPHTGSSHYEKGGRKIPAIAIGNHSADRLALACSQHPVNVKMMSNCTMKDSVLSFNVIGEVKGSEYPDEYIVVGGHIDSWDVGEGAHDDGAGCVQSMQVLSAFHHLGIRPKHSIRAVLFINEENGGRGGFTYADSAKSKHEKHIMAMESDAGGFSPRGIGLEMTDSLKTIVRDWQPLFLPYGVYDFTQEDGGVDISFLKKQQVPLAGLMPDSQRYFDIHHNRTDVFEAVNHRELKLGAVTMAAFVYLVDQYFAN